MKFFAVFLLFFSFNAVAQLPAEAQTDSAVIRQLANNIMEHGTAYSNLRTLCKQVGPRLGGSPNAAKAVVLAEKMLRAAGCDTVYLQPCLVTHWERGAKEKGSYTVAGKNFPVRMTALGNSEGFDGREVSGQLVEVKSMTELRNLGAAVAGKIVFFNMKMNPDYFNSFEAYGESGAGRRSGPAQAAKYGAVGAWVRSLASNIDDHPHTGATQYNDSFPKIPAVAISTAEAERISVLLAQGNTIKANFSTHAHVFGQSPSYNVIGEIRGAQYPDEIVTVGGHLDSWDLAEGAQDDGAGVVQSIEVIRGIKSSGLRPERTIRAVCFMNEENGEGGGRAYFENAKSAHENIVFALESDDGGFTPRGFGLDMSPGQRQQIISWGPLLLPYGIYDFSHTGTGSDIEWLKGIGTALAGFEPDSQRYFDIHHSEMDVFESVSERELKWGAVDMTALVWLVATHGLGK